MNRLTHLLAAPASPRRRSPPSARPSTEAGRRRGWARLCRAAFGASVALLASGAACGDDGAAAAPIATPDAGPACEAGSEGCACMFGSGCQQGLLCIARRCLPTDATPEMTPTRPPRPPPTLPNPPAPEPPDIGGLTAPPDAGDGNSLDAGTLPDASDAG